MRIIIFLWLIASSFLLSDTLTINNEQHTFDNFLLQKYEDKTASLDIEQIQQITDFTEVSNFISEGYSSSVFWYKIEISNDMNRSVETMVDAGKLIYDVDLYIVSSDETVYYKGGNGVKFEDRVIQSATIRFPVYFKANETKTLYFRLKHITTLFTSLTIMDEDSWVKSDLLKFQLLGLAYGGILVLLLYNFFLFLSVKEKVFLYYVLYVGTFVFWLMMSEGYFPFTELSGDICYTMAANTTVLSFIFMVLFGREVLSTKYYTPILDKILYLSVWGLSLSLFLNFYNPVLIIHIMNILSIIILLLLFWSAIKSYRAGNKVAIFYIQAQLVFFIMILPYLLMSVNLFEYNAYVQYAPLVGSVYEIVVFSLALAYRVKVLKDENIQVVVEAKNRLEHKVDERTKELKSAQDKLNELNLNLELRVKQEVEKNEQHQKVLAQQSRLTAMGEMLSSIAHQWRQPLNRINSNVSVLRSVLRRDSIDAEMLVEHTGMIEQNTKYMSDTIEDFANFFHPDKTETKFLLQSVIEKALELIDQRNGNVEINIISEKELELFSFEKEYLQVVLIILNNAIDNFKLKAIEKPNININIKEYDGMATLCICDNGGGIEEGDIDRIFDPYYTTKFAKEGTGLGLYVAKMMIESSMHGHLQVKNQNAGACFEIITPLRKNKCLV
jgi:signal transduction histidine kinase